MYLLGKDILWKAYQVKEEFLRRGNEMTNIRKIAELAGVSVSTVSRVLNNHPYVNEQKRKEILAIIEELNYTQNVNAIHLVKGKRM